MLGVPLLLPAVMASTEVRAFHAEVEECSTMLMDCRTVQDGTFQIDCQQGTCEILFHVDARYESQLPATTKTIETYGRYATGAQSDPACRSSTTAKVARCVGTGTQRIMLPTATCRSYEIVSEVREQPLRLDVSAFETAALQQTVTTGFQLCRSGSGSVSVTSG